MACIRENLGKRLFCACGVVLLFFGIAWAQSKDREHHNKGLSLAIEGKFEDAEKEFQAGLHEDYPLESPLKTALAIVNDAISKKITKQTAIFIFQGTEYGNKGMLDKAIQEFNYAIQSDPNYVIGYNTRGSLYAIKGDYERALSDFNQIISLKPKYAKAYLNRGNIYTKKDMYDEALADYNKAIELDPRYVNAYYNRGQFYYNRGRVDQAISDYTKAINLYAKFATAYYGRGLAYLDNAQYDKALADFNKVEEFTPQDISVYYYKAVASQGCGFKKEALQDYALFIRLAPSQSKYTQYLRLIENAKKQMMVLEGKK